QHDLGVLRATVGGQALGLYRHRHAQKFSLDEHCVLRKDMTLIKDTDRCYPLPHSDEDALAVEREAVAGGLFRQYYKGRVQGPIYVLDIQSAYSAAMKETFMPCKLLGCLYHPSINDLRDHVAHYPCVAWVAGSF